MPDIYKFSEPEIIAFFLVLMRMGAFLVAWPIFGSAQVPAPIKLFFSLCLSFLLFPVLKTAGVLNFASDELIHLTIREVFIGVTLGFIARIFFFSISIAGEIMATSIGLASAQLFNPMSGSQVSAIEQLKVILASLFFLGINGHHLFLTALVESYSLLPLGEWALSFKSFAQFGSIVQEVTSIGLKMSAPILVSMLFMNVAMAVIGRAVPQINVLITSLPVNALVGLFIMMIGLPLFLWQMNDVLELSLQRIFYFMKAM